MSSPSTNSEGRRAVIVLGSLAAFIATLWLLLFMIRPRDMRSNSLSIAEAKAYGTYVGRVVQESGPPVILYDSKVERLWHRDDGFFATADQRVLDEGYTTTVRIDRKRLPNAFVQLAVSDDPARPAPGGVNSFSCCAVYTRGRPRSAALIMWGDDPARRDTVYLRFVP